MWFTVAKLFMILVFAGWMMVWVMRPTRTWTNHFWNPILDTVVTKAYGDTGAYTLIYTSPILLVAFLGAIYLSYKKNKKDVPKGPLRSMRHLWTCPVFVRGPLALVSFSELLLLGAFVALYTWTTSKHLANSFSRINIPFMHGHGHAEPLAPLWERKFNIVGGRLGAAGAVPFAFLFFPVARFSSLFQLINIPFEHAVRYHIWTGHIMMVLWSAHSVVYLIYWPIAHKSKEFILWGKTDIAGFTGLLAWIFGLAIWLTSLNPVRKHKFELFYYTHQLYILFIIGFALHVGEKWLAMMIAGIFLFFIDRLFRFLQSRRRVEVVSARLISSETMELTFAKSPGLQYPPASVIFLNLPAVSYLQWHPFTVTTCSSTEVDRISVIIKCNGRWTQKLRDLVLQESSRSKESSPAHFEAAIEGPHGHDMDHLLNFYDTYIFIAGGSGIAPFLPLLKHLLHKVQMKQIPLPKTILLVLSVKKSQELEVLKLVSPSTICPDYTVEQLADVIQVQAFVTQEDLEDTKTKTEVGMIVDTVTFAGRATSTKLVHAEPSPSRSVLVRAVSTKRGYKLYAATILTSFLGYMLLAGFIHRFYIYPLDHNTYQACSRSGRGFLSLMEYVCGVCLFGGATVILWTRWKGEKDLSVVEAPRVEFAPCDKGLGYLTGRVEYGARPNIQEIIRKHAGGNKKQVGVFSCGPYGMQEAVGLQCQALKLNFHPLNFEL